jgi:hypothetical protein
VFIHWAKNKQILPESNNGNKSPKRRVLKRMHEDGQ